VLQDGVFAFENLNNGRARGHAFNEFAEERTVLVNGVEAFSFALAHPDALGCDHAQAVVFKYLGDGAGQVALGGIRLDHRKRAFNRHCSTLRSSWLDNSEKVGGLYPPASPETRGFRQFHAGATLRPTPL